MTIIFRIQYHTTWGESLHVLIDEKPQSNCLQRMDTTGKAKSIIIWILQPLSSPTVMKSIVTTIAYGKNSEHFLTSCV